MTSVTAFDFKILTQEQAAYKAKYAIDDYRLKPTIARSLEDAIEAAPMFERLASAGKRVIRTIHSTPTLYQRASRGNLEFYIGRAGATPEHVFGRFKDHAMGKGHLGGAVLCRTATANVVRWETVAIRALSILRSLGRLCVANVSTHGGGRVASLSECVLYLTWGWYGDPVDVSTPTRRDVDMIAREVAARIPEVTEDTVRRAVEPSTRPDDETVDLWWANGHHSV